jgi:FtsZ-binding cell division protein ZapB
VFIYSLTALGLLFVGLSQKEPINTGYRNYKLTRILKPLLQDGKVAIICCINPSLAYCKTTEYTLKFAERAKRVKTTAVRNMETVHSKATTLSLRLELEESKVENDRLKNQNVQLTKYNLQFANENEQLQRISYWKRNWRNGRSW